MIKENIDKLVSDFIESLEKPHNYERIVNQYLKACTEMEKPVSFTTRHLFLVKKAPVYKTALNKFFNFIGEYSEITITESEKEIILVLPKDFYKNLAESSIKTCDNIIKSYIKVFGIGFNIEDLKKYLKKIENVATHNTNLSFLKKYFHYHGVLVMIETKEKIENFTNKGTFSQEQLDKIWNYTKQNYKIEKQIIIGLMLFSGLRSDCIIKFYKSNGKYFSTSKARAKKPSKPKEYLIPIQIQSEVEEFFADRNYFTIKSTSTIRKWFNEMVKEVIGDKNDENGKPLSSHSFRHSVALNAKQNGTSVETVRNILKHKSRESTLHYMQIKE
jgi:integrase